MRSFKRFLGGEDGLTGRTRNAALFQNLVELFAVLRAVDVALGGAQDRHAHLGQRLGQLDGGLPAELHHCAVRLFHIAEELHHPPFGGTPRQDGHGGKIRPQHKVAFLHLHKAGNGAAVEADTVFQSFGQIVCQHSNVLLNAKDIAEGKAHKFDVVVLHKIKDVLLGRIAHNGFPFK